jgi:hypothetical protein
MGQLALTISEWSGIGEVQSLEHGRADIGPAAIEQALNPVHLNCQKGG